MKYPQDPNSRTRIALENKEFVELSRAAPGLRLEPVYATSNNFAKTAIYPDRRMFLTKPTAVRLMQAHRSLRPFGFGITIYDGLRPVEAQRVLYAAYPNPNYVANPYAGEGSRHSYGMTVDVSLFSLHSGKPIEMPSQFDDFTWRSHWSNDSLPHHVIRRRRLLELAMRGAGFLPNPLEWWHWDSRDYFACPHQPVQGFDFWKPYLVAA